MSLDTSFHFIVVRGGGRHFRSAGFQQNRFLSLFFFFEISHAPRKNNGPIPNAMIAI